MNSLVQLWSARSPREQAMLAVLGALCLGLAGWFGLVEPLRAARQASAARLERAVETRLVVARATAEIADLERAARPAPSATPVDAAVSQAAEAAGLTLARVEVEASGGVQAVLEGAPSTSVFPWLLALQREHGVVASHLTVLKGDGGVDVDATFVRAGP
ncbi:MAG: type II secretion system protein GspM [Phenylobacterium sp.]|uniref:type II secretion system protein GspM n=1 Tax=Phenylobacterium sp. TaxID=1871053 RepID=UPI00391BC793